MRGVGGRRAVDRDAAGGDRFSGFGARARQTPAHQLRVEAVPCHPQASVGRLPHGSDAGERVERRYETHVDAVEHIGVLFDRGVLELLER